MPARRRVLFVSEAVTLAQVVRLYVLAQSLPRRDFEVHFAAAHFDELIFGAPGTPALRRWPIHSLGPRAVDWRVRSGLRIYSTRTLRRYLRDDLALIEAVRPDAIIGDLRLSLAVAAPLRRVPYGALINAYWSPHAVRPGFPLPEHPIVRLLGPRLAAQYFPQALPRVFAHFAAPVNRLRRAHGLAAIGDLPAVLSFGDAVLHPDPATLVPTAGAPAHHHHLGPVLWSPALPRPPFWSKLDAKRPTVYVTLGSSGRAELLPKVLAAVTSLGAQALVATAGRHEIASPPAGVFVAPFLPGAEAAARADLVVSNGGSTTSYQALAAGRPVIGIPANLDQYLAMDAIVRAGAGVQVRAGTASIEGLREALLRGLEDVSLRAAAQRLCRDFRSAEPQQAFERALEGLFLKPAAISGIQDIGALGFG